jgi:hypothetical protein
MDFSYVSPTATSDHQNAADNFHQLARLKRPTADVVVACRGRCRILAYSVRPEKGRETPGAASSGARRSKNLDRITWTKPQCSRAFG